MVTGRAGWADQPQGKLAMKFGAFAPWTEYKILDTDYHSIALVHTCTTVMGAWTREDTQLLARFPSAPGDKLWDK